MEGSEIKVVTTTSSGAEGLIERLKKLGFGEL